MADRPLPIDIRRPLLLKANDLVLLAGQDGNIADDFPGFGLFFRDTCYLSIYELLLHGTKPMLLMASDAEGMAAAIGLTNAALAAVDGAVIPDHKLSLRRTLALPEDGPAFVDTITIGNFTGGAVTLPVSLAFRAAFEDMFVLRGTPGGSAAGCGRRSGTERRCAYATRARTACGGRCWPTSPCRRSWRPARRSRRSRTSSCTFRRGAARTWSSPSAWTSGRWPTPPDAARAPRGADAIRADKEAAAALLPDGVDTLALRGIRAGGGTAALRFARSGGTVATEVLAATGIEVAVE